VVEVGAAVGLRLVLRPPKRKREGERSCFEEAVLGTLGRDPSDEVDVIGLGSVGKVTLRAGISDVCLLWEALLLGCKGNPGVGRDAVSSA
jgi:hypothetical protein